MFNPNQGHPVVMENNPRQIRYNRRKAPQPGYWGGRHHLGGYGRPTYGDIGGKGAKAFFRTTNPWMYVGGVLVIVGGFAVAKWVLEK